MYENLILFIITKYKQFTQFYIQNTIWTSLCTINSFQTVSNAIMYSKELQRYHCARLNAIITLSDITLVKRSLNTIHLTQYILVD